MNKDLVIIYSFLTINAINFVALYIPKILIIYFKPNKNTKRAFNNEIWRRMQKDNNLNVEVTM